tara:strand:+ start:2021 stop:2257 length:237 start_codon:yes stop_codon:yes gene_type:complete
MINYEYTPNTQSAISQLEELIAARILWITHQCSSKMGRELACLEDKPLRAMNEKLTQIHSVAIPIKITFDGELKYQGE